MSEYLTAYQSERSHVGSAGIRQTLSKSSPIAAWKAALPEKTMPQPLHPQRRRYRILGISLLLLVLSGSVFAACTDNQLDFWREGEGWKPGAMVWAGSDDIPFSTIPKGAPIGYLEFGESNLPIRDAKQKPDSDNPDKEVWWLQVQKEKDKPLIWIPANYPGVLCRSYPLEAEESGLLRKAIVRTWNQEDQIEGSVMSVECQTAGIRNATEKLSGCDPRCDFWEMHGNAPLGAPAGSAAFQAALSG